MKYATDKKEIAIQSEKDIRDIYAFLYTVFLRHGNLKISFTLESEDDGE